MADDAKSSRKPSRRPKKDALAEPLAVVGIGVCAASFRAMLALFAGMQEGLGAAFVIAVLQQDGLSVVTVVEAMSAQARDAVIKAEDGERLQAGHIYVGGGSELITITDGHIVYHRPGT